MKSLRESLPDKLRERFDETIARGIPSDEVCPRCAVYSHPGHECCECLDGGRVASGNGGLLELCPSCSAPRLAESGGEEPLTREEWMKQARIPIKFGEVSLENWTLDRWRELKGLGDPRPVIYQYVKQWPPARPFLTLIGETGAGKTHLGVAAAWEASFRHAARVRMYRGSEILDRYRAAYDKETAIETEASVDNELRRVPLLVLDDLSTAGATDWATKKILSLVNLRYEEAEPTIVTTNEPDLDARTLRRLLDEGSCFVGRFDVGG